MKQNFKERVVYSYCGLPKLLRRTFWLECCLADSTTSDSHKRSYLKKMDFPSGVFEYDGKVEDVA